MGFSPSFLRLLARAHKRVAFKGPVLTLGRQAISATYEDVLAIWRSEGIDPHPLKPGQLMQTNIPSWQDGPNARFTNDAAVFASLAGIEVLTLDVSEYENADYVLDLNHPISAELEERFGLIIDSGTLEHVFDINQAFRNVNRMLKTGGRVIHYSPGTNWLQHGFYQFSPTLFYDYYGANKFTDMRCLITEVTRKAIKTNYSSMCDCWEWDVERPYSQVISDDPLSVYFEAEKNAASTITNVPQQGQYLGSGEGGRLGANRGNPAPASLPRRIYRKYVPTWLRDIAYGLRGPDIKVKPWGLKYIGKV